MSTSDYVVFEFTVTSVPSLPDASEFSNVARLSQLSLSFLVEGVLDNQISLWHAVQ